MDELLSSLRVMAMQPLQSTSAARILNQAADEIERLGADAERYRWMRSHCRFANDSLQELWFDASISDGEQSALDQSVDSQKAAK